ncbi:MAG: carboxypeptidase-like regulatory domain-containing protein [Bacteroidota bacterium]
MRYITLVLIVFALSIQVSTAQSVRGVVLDSQTGEPVAYANIGVPNKKHGTVANAQGQYELSVSNKHLKDTIQIASVGYKTNYVLGSRLIKTPKILLEPDVIELDEVTVNIKQLKEKTIGNKTKSKSLRGGFKNATLGHEIGAIFRTGKKETFVKSLNTNIVSNTNKSMKFRLNFYSVKKGLPDEKLVFKNIIFTIDAAEGPFSLDLTSYDILLKKDFFCTMELVENQNPDESIFFSAGLFGNKLVYRETSHATWDKIKVLGIGFNLTVAR